MLVRIITPQSLSLIQCSLSMVHVNETVGVERYRLPGDLAQVMNVIIVSCWTCVSLSKVIILPVCSTYTRRVFETKP